MAYQWVLVMLHASRGKQMGAQLGQANGAESACSDTSKWSKFDLISVQGYQGAQSISSKK